MGWADSMAKANTEASVLALVHAFVGTFSVEELERLPASLRPGSFANGAALLSYTARLIQYDSDSSDGATRIALRLSSFLSSATARLRDIQVQA
jgi:hypothetical protein